MPDAKGVDGAPLPRPSLRAAAARRPVRKPGEAAPAAATSPAAAPPTFTPAPPPVERPAPPPPERQAPPERQSPPERASLSDRFERTIAPPRPGVGSRLEDLYRMPMPQLFKLAEKEGMHEHNGMSRGQLILGIVRRQIERGDKVIGSGTLEVLPDGYGFLRSQAHNYLASRKTSTSRRRKSAA